MKEARDAIIDGKKDWRDLMHEKVGEIKAQIIERDGQVWMIKECPHPRPLRRHDGHGLEVPHVDRAEFPRPRHSRAQRRRPAQAWLSNVRYGRGSVLTVDLTNRCNMMCDPCFMDANQVGYVHELRGKKSRKFSTTR